ncbi:THAP domain-containing protein 3 [Sorex fumeus]|uniref:THAP domain-containing protein 3 n=1 Tax=Sorex fumeus TaxID=62283 RepID=UPI0024ADE8E5|nr:THAP domain-containing protein 3 [Sorex fumeus]
MPKSCAARQCCNRYSSRRKQLTFHRFPFSRPELLRQWVRNMGRGNFQPKQHTVLCSEHFRPECFSAFGNRKNLKHNAVPTEFASPHPPQLALDSRDGTSEGGKPSSEDGQVPPCPEAAELPTPRHAHPAQPSDHSYALLDAATLKQRLFRALRDNERLHRRLRAQRLLLWRLSRRLRGRRGVGEGPGAGPNKRKVYWVQSFRVGPRGHACPAA